jgi:hypothetical protein
VLISSRDAEGAVPLDDADCSGRKIAVIVDRGVQSGKTADAGLNCDMKVYVPGKDIPGLASRFTSIVLYSLFAKEG